MKHTGNAYRAIDLTHPLRSGESVYPGDPVVRFRPCAAIANEGYRLTELTLGSHSGTHVDAPCHFLPGGETIDRLPVEILVGPATVVDVSGQPGTVIEPELLCRHERLFQPGARILFRSGWSDRYATDGYWHDFPSLSPAAARWLVARGVAMVGFDTPGPSKEVEEVHAMLLAAKPPVVIVESLANLAELPEEFLLVVAPLKLVGLDGAPARVFALVSGSLLPPVARDRSTGEGRLRFGHFSQ